MWTRNDQVAPSGGREELKYRTGEKEVRSIITETGWNLEVEHKRSDRKKRIGRGQQIGYNHDTTKIDKSDESLSNCTAVEPDPITSRQWGHGGNAPVCSVWRTGPSGRAASWRPWRWRRCQPLSSPLSHVPGWRSQTRPGCCAPSPGSAWTWGSGRALRGGGCRYASQTW